MGSLTSPRRAGKPPASRHSPPPRPRSGRSVTGIATRQVRREPWQTPTSKLLASDPPLARGGLPRRGPARRAAPARGGPRLRGCRRPAAARNSRHADRLLHHTGSAGAPGPRAGARRARRGDGGSARPARLLVQPRVRAGPPGRAAAGARRARARRGAPATRTVRGWPQDEDLASLRAEERFKALVAPAGPEAIAHRLG